MNVGFLGLGLMGSRMAANLVQKGHAVTVWNRTREKADDLARRGARVAERPRDAAAGMDAIAMCLANPAAVEATFFGPGGVVEELHGGQLVIDFSTGSPALAARLDAACRQHGARFLESPVTGSKGGAAAGTLILMCGGDAVTLTAAVPVLRDVASKWVHIGAVGTATRVKLIGNTFIGLMLEALCEGMVLCQKAGIDPKKLLEIVQVSGYASPYWDFKAKPMLARDFETHFSIDLMHKDLTLALAAADEVGAVVPGLAMVREQFQQARAAGLGDEDIAALIKVLETQNGIVA